jgi:hypothetical protein
MLGMGILALAADERVSSVGFTGDSLSVALMDGRTITFPWFGIRSCWTQLKPSGTAGRFAAADMEFTGRTSTKI